MIKLSDDEKVKDNGDGTLTITQICHVTHKPYSVTVKKTAFIAWQYGTKIQNAMPEMSMEDREFLISGTSPEGFKRLFPPGKED